MKYYVYIQIRSRERYPTEVWFDRGVRLCQKACILSRAAGIMPRAHGQTELLQLLKMALGSRYNQNIIR